MTTEPTVRIMTTQQSVCCLPEGHQAYRHLAVTVEHRGRGTWAVLWGGLCLGADGEWDYEPSSSNREDEWLATHRFSEREALQRAAEQAETVTVMGRTAADILAQDEAR